MARFRNRPSEIEAVQWTGDNVAEIAAFGVDYSTYGNATALSIIAGKDGAQGNVPVPVGHWIVRQPGDLSDHWPVDPDYFAAKYEEVPDA